MVTDDDKSLFETGNICCCYDQVYIGFTFHRHTAIGRVGRKLVPTFCSGSTNAAVVSMHLQDDSILVTRIGRLLPKFSCHSHVPIDCPKAGIGCLDGGNF